MLRVILHALISPPLDDVVTQLSSSVRRNLILIAKILQATASSIEFGEKEEWMTFANPFIRKNIPVLNAFLDAVSLSLPNPSPEAPPRAFNMEDIDLHDLFIVHDCFYRNRIGLIRSLSNNTASSITSDVLDQFFTHLNELGPSPIHLIGEFQQIPSIRKAHFVNHQYHFLSSSSGNSSGRPAPSPIPRNEEFPQWNEQSLAEAMFFYIGNPTIDGLPSLYLIMNRIQQSFFNSLDAIIGHLLVVLGRLPNSKYVLVVDLSWLALTQELKKNLRGYIEQMRTIFPRCHKKNLHKIFLVHPSSSARDLILLVKAISSIKLDAKVIEVDDWHELLKDFHSDDVLLPESSKSSITKSYHVTKVNSRGKEQKRLVKFTLNSLLNIDPSGIVTNEKLLSQIESISARLPVSSPFELILRFYPGSGDALGGVRRRSFHTRLRRTTEKDKLLRRYLFDSACDLQTAIEEIFRSGFLSGMIPDLPQEFSVIKINPSRKAHHRIFKLTVDSLLNLNQQCRIRDEISFAGLDVVELDSFDTTILWIKRKTEPLPSKIICSNAFLLSRAIREGTERYQAGQSFSLRTSTSTYQKDNLLTPGNFDMHGIEAHNWQQVIPTIKTLCGTCHSHLQGSFPPQFCCQICSMPVHSLCRALSAPCSAIPIHPEAWRRRIEFERDFQQATASFPYVLPEKTSDEFSTGRFYPTNLRRECPDLAVSASGATPQYPKGPDLLPNQQLVASSELSTDSSEDCAPDPIELAPLSSDVWTEDPIPIKSVRSNSEVTGVCKRISQLGRIGTHRRSTWSATTPTGGLWLAYHSDLSSPRSQLPTPTFRLHHPPPSLDPPRSGIIIFDGHIKGGSLDQLTRCLFDPPAEVDHHVYATSFRLTYASFTNPSELIHHLTSLYCETDELCAGTSCIPKVFRLRICNFFKRWIPDAFKDMRASDIEMIRTFACGTVCQADGEKLQIVILEALKKGESVSVSTLNNLSGVQFASPPPAPFLSATSSSDLLSLHPVELARQMTIIHHRLYRRISPLECMDKAWTLPEKDLRAPTITRLIGLFNLHSEWIVTSIVSTTDLSLRAKHI